MTKQKQIKRFRGMIINDSTFPEYIILHNHDTCEKHWFPAIYDRFGVPTNVVPKRNVNAGLPTSMFARAWNKEISIETRAILDKKPRK